MQIDFQISYVEASQELVARGFSKVSTHNHPRGFCSDGSAEWWFRPLVEQAALLYVDGRGSWAIDTHSENNNISCLFAERRQSNARKGG